MEVSHLVVDFDIPLLGVNADDNPLIYYERNANPVFISCFELTGDPVI